MRARLFRHGGRDARLYRAGTGGDGIQRMRLRAVGLRHRSSDTPLRPSRTGPRAKRIRRDQQNGARRKAKRGIKRAEARTNDDDPAGCDLLHRRGPQRPSSRERSIIRCTATRAFSETSASTSTAPDMVCSDQSTFSSVIFFM